MKFSIGPQFSREFSLEDRMIIIDYLNDTLNKFLSEKKYNTEVEKIYIGVICVSKGFEPFFMARPLKVLKTEPAIEYEITLEFELFFKANTEDRKKILHNEFLSQSKEILKNKKMKKFDLMQFLDDVAGCFKDNN